MHHVPERLPASRISAWLQRVPARFPGKTRVAAFLVYRVMDAAVPRRVLDVHGLDLLLPNLRDSLALDLFANGAYEPSTVAWITDHLPMNGTLLDIGSNVGTVGLPVALRRNDARVICIEGSPSVFAYLDRNIRANGLADRVSARHCVVGASTESHVPFYSPVEGYGRGSMSPVFTQAAEQIANLRLDDLVASLPSEPELLKIDVEGFEKQVLEGGIGFLRRRSPKLVFEFCDWAEQLAGNAPGDSQRLLMDIGYRLYRLADGQPITRALTDGFEMIVATRALAEAGRNARR